MVPLSVLDQSVAIAGRPQGEAIRNTIAMAKACEALGYRRFWVSEHHNHATIVGTAPEVLIAAIAARTSAIRIGSAGVMLPHYSPYHVAEQFRVLDAIAPGRIDLGLGRAPGSDGRTAYALNPQANERPQYFPSDVRDLLAWLDGTPLMEGHPFRQVKAHPEGETVPEVWILGSSDYGAQVAAHFGLPYAFAWFFTEGRGGREALELYRHNYKPSARHPKPHTAICVWALAAASQEEADFHYASRARSRLLRDRGVFAPLEPPDVAAGYDYTDAERRRMDEMRATALVGAPATVAGGIAALADQLSLDEVAVVTWTYDEAVRLESYRLLAIEAGFAPAPDISS
ncbi:MAG: LLM class flavin-dependent oxidoreductase [Hyphomicrobiaceae bacterium]